MMGLFLEEFESGRVFNFGSYTFTAANIRTYTTKFVPVEFHMKASEAKKGLFGKTAAAGFHTCSAWMACFVAANDKARAARTGPLPEVGPSPGVSNVRWPRPVHVDDAIAFRATVVSSRYLATRPGWGLVSFLGEGHNVAGELMMSFEGKVLVAAKTKPETLSQN